MDDKIANIIKADIERAGYEIVEIKSSSFGGITVIRVFIDKPGGITVYDCSRVTNTIRFLLNGSDLNATRYNLEVSSPGLDRPMTSERDFLRNTGKEITVELNAAMDDKFVFEGKILGFENGAVTIETGAAAVQIPVGKIARAKLKLNFGSGRKNV